MPDLSDKEHGLHNNMMNAPQDNAAAASAASAASATASEQDGSSHKEPLMPESKEISSDRSRSLRPDRNTLSGNTKSQRTGDYGASHHNNHHPHSPTPTNQPATTDNGDEKQNTDIIPHAQKTHELGYFYRRMSLFLSGKTDHSSPPFANKGQDLREQYSNLDLPGYNPLKGSPESNDQPDLSASGKIQEKDYAVRQNSSKHESDVFYPVNRPGSLDPQGESSHVPKSHSSETTITINIGRIEVKSSAPPPTPAASDSKTNLKTKPKFSPSLSLGEYLKQRSQQQGQM